MRSLRACAVRSEGCGGSMIRPRAGRAGFLREIRDLNPGYFALVMATGIVSKAMRLDGADALSGALLGATIVAYVLLAAAYAWRLVRYRREFLADTRAPGRAFAFFAFVAASDVLGARVAGGGHEVAAAALRAVSGAG